jgi:hypothetical protein
VTKHMSDGNHEMNYDLVKFNVPTIMTKSKRTCHDASRNCTLIRIGT